MPLNFFYTMVQKSQKWPKTQIKGGGPALRHILSLSRAHQFVCGRRSLALIFGSNIFNVSHLIVLIDCLHDKLGVPKLCKGHEIPWFFSILLWEK